MSFLHVSMRALPVGVGTEDPAHPGGACTFGERQQVRGQPGDLHAEHPGGGVPQQVVGDEGPDVRAADPAVPAQRREPREVVGTEATRVGTLRSP